MTYHKRSAVVRKCAHCRTKFESNHKSRLYCCQSCNTLAWKARQGPAGAAKPTRPPVGASLDLSAQTVGVVALGSALGALAVEGGTYLAQQLTQGGSDFELLRADVRQLRQDLGLPIAPPKKSLSADFLPEALRAVTGPVVQLAVGGRMAPFVRLSYHGHVLYHHPDQGLVLWEERSGKCHHVHSEQQLDQLAAHPPTPIVAAAALAPLSLGDDFFGAQFLADMQQRAVQEAAASAAMDAALRVMLAPEIRTDFSPIPTAESEAAPDSLPG